MERLLFESRKRRSTATLLNFFQNCRKTTDLFLSALLLLLALSSPAFAAVEGFVAQASDGNYHQYSYGELLDSYALKLLGIPNGLYEDFAVKKSVALLDTISGYIDYSDVLDQYALALTRGQKFNLNLYIESSVAKKAIMPAAIKVVSLSEGKVVRVARNLGQSSPPAPVTAVTVSQPKTDLTGPASAQPVSNSTVNPEKPPEQVPEKPVIVTPLISASQVSLSQAQKWAADRGAHQRFIDIAPLYWEYGRKTGLCPEVLYAQSAHETNFGHYTGQVTPEFNNWAGIKIATPTGDKPEDHEKFATPEDGVRGHFNHMAAYVGLVPIDEPHGRYHVVLKLSWAGTITAVEELSGKWAPSPTYHERITSMLEEMK